MTPSKVVIGLGSGRCGTRSLAELLNLQPDSLVTHEALPMPWNRKPDVTSLMIGKLLERTTNIIGDIGYYWINYVEDLLSARSEAKFICLKRDRQEVIDSMWDFTRGLNVHPTDDWFRMYPRYSADLKEAVGFMWDHYYAIADRLQIKYPENFVSFSMHRLNTETGVKSILDFAGIPKGEQVIKVGIHLNKRDE